MNVFKAKDEMPPKDNSPDVVRAALTDTESRVNYKPALGYNFSVTGSGRDAMDVKHVDRPRFGHKV